MEEEAWRGIPRESFPDLLGNPDSSGIGRDVKMDDFPTFVVDKNQDVKHLEKYRWDREQIHGNDLVGVVSQKSFPGL